MDSTSALSEQVIDALEHDSIVLTANQRAARTLRRAFDLRQRALGKTDWNPPAILAWDAWLGSLWKRLLLDGRTANLLLSSTQEHTLWRAIIASDASTASLRPVDALAETAADAWTLLHAYRCRNRLQSHMGNADTRAFARWAGEFGRRCGHANYLTEAELPEALRAAVAGGHLTLRTGLLLVGFDTITPAQAALLEAIGASGSRIDELGQAPPAPSRTLVHAPDEHAELATCARWLRKRIIEQPNASLAVIVPNIETDRAEIDRVFRSILAPELNDISASTAAGPYEFSLGVPLAQTPIAASALELLRWVLGPLPLERVSALLLSPYFAASTPIATAELLARAEFDAFTLRQQHIVEPQITVDGLYGLVSGSKQTAGMPLLREHLRALRTACNRKEMARESPFAAWAASFHDLLEAAGWAPPNQLDSVEFQTRHKWEDALDELTTLDFDSAADGARVTFQEALDALERIATRTLFAPESRHAPVQIMGPLESAGATFDAVWFLRASDLAWPAQSSPNPLLSWLLQHELGMPGSDPVRDTARARRITDRIAASAPTALFSYARETGDGHQRPSPILSPLELERRSADDVSPTQAAAAPIELDKTPDDAPIPATPDSVLQGGAGILQSQAACGFRAFAEKRLFSTTPDTVELGLDASERGNLVHAVLDYFWEAVESQATLTSMTAAERTAQLNRSIDRAIAEDYANPAPGWPRAYIDAERQRLLTLLLHWLEFEDLHRPPFTVKHREEKLRDVSIGPLRLEIRVDRVDTNLSNGEPAGDIILDYKTGAATPRDWLGPRPDAPQLPLYTVVADSPDLAAVAFASVRPGNLMGIAGYEAGGAGRSNILPKTAKLNNPSLAAQVEEWRGVLTLLAEEFHAGNASVSPKHYPQTCQYCEQRLLCRLNPTVLDPDVLEELEEETDAFGSEDNDFA
ncbi:MAG TPA: PD-(D/E)XK nuclease family protein [Acidobacteriaceae bacterium]